MPTATTRTEKSIRNACYALVGHLAGILAMFACRTAFIRLLGAEYLGVSGLFGNVLSLISLAELGIGSAILVSLYKPLAAGEEERIKALMHAYGIAYRVIALVVFALGMLLCPFLDVLMKDEPAVPALTLVYSLYVLDAAQSYCCSFKILLVEADQNGHIVNLYDTGFLIGQNLLQIALLWVTRDFVLYMGIQAGVTLVRNVVLSRKADRMYPCLRTLGGSRLVPAERRRIVRNVGAMLSHEVGNVVVNGTDNLLISRFVGVVWVGLYANYLLVVSTLQGILGRVLGAVTAGIGNLNATETGDKPHRVFKTLLFLNFWLYGFCSVCLVVLFSPFIRLWAGPGYLLDEGITVIIVLNFYMGGMRTAGLAFRDTLGLFWNDRFKPVAEAAINLAASILLLARFGIAGVLWGTLISTVATSFWVEPLILYRRAFHKPLRGYFAQYAAYFAATLLAAAATWSLARRMPFSGFGELVGKGVLCLVVPNLVFLALFFRTEAFRQVMVIAGRYAGRIRSRGRGSLPVAADTRTPGRTEQGDAPRGTGASGGKIPEPP